MKQEETEQKEKERKLKIAVKTVLYFCLSLFFCLDRKIKREWEKHKGGPPYLLRASKKESERQQIEVLLSTNGREYNMTLGVHCKPIRGRISGGKSSNEVEWFTTFCFFAGLDFDLERISEEIIKGGRVYWLAVFFVLDLDLVFVDPRFMLPLRFFWMSTSFGFETNKIPRENSRKWAARSCCFISTLTPFFHRETRIFSLFFLS